MNQHEWEAFKAEFPEVMEQSEDYPRLKRGMVVEVDVDAYNRHLSIWTADSHFSADANPVEISHFMKSDIHIINGMRYGGESVAVWSKNRQFMTSLPTRFIRG